MILSQKIRYAIYLTRNSVAFTQQEKDYMIYRLEEMDNDEIDSLITTLERERENNQILLINYYQNVLKLGADFLQKAQNWYHQIQKQRISQIRNKEQREKDEAEKLLKEI